MITGERAGIDLDLVEAHIVAGRQGGDIVVGTMRGSLKVLLVGVMTPPESTVMLEVL